MFHQFDHRAASVLVDENLLTRQGYADATRPEQYLDPLFSPLPRYWVDACEVRNKLGLHWRRSWFLGFKKITSPTNERTALATLFPLVAVNDSVPLLLLADDVSTKSICALVANLSALTLDYVCRQKLGGVNLNSFVVKQLSVLPPDRYTPLLIGIIVPRVMELVYTAWGLQAFAKDILDEVGPETWAHWFEDVPVQTSPPPTWASEAFPPPFVWDEKRRAHLRAELDGLYAHLYGLTRDELDYILDTFPIVRRKDEARCGEYRTKRLILEYYEELQGRF